MFRSIFVPLDGSGFAETALPVGTTVARRSGGALELVMVQDPVPAYSMGDFQEQPQEWRREYLTAVEERLEEVLPGKVRHTLLIGSVTAELERHAEEAESDLIVMATHGRGPFSRFWLGSVADHVVRKSFAPVLLIRPEEDEEEVAPPDPAGEVVFENILVPLDGSDEAETILDAAVAMAGLHGSGIVLTRIVHYPAEIVSSYLPDTVVISEEIVEAGKAEAKGYLERVAADLSDRGLDVETDVRVDVHPASGIMRAAEERGADLIALATHGRGGVERTLLGSVADKLIRSAHLPTLLVRPGASA